VEALSKGLEIAPPAAVTSGPCETDARGLDALVREHLPFVYRLLRHLGVSDADVDDATQQVFLVLSRRRSDVTPGRERAFLSSTAVRIASRWRRTHRRRREVDAETLDLDGCGALHVTPETQLERAQAERLLLQVLERLPDRLRTVFVLFEIEELTLREISETLDTAQGTVASRLRTAREAFQREVSALSHRASMRRIP
jgi:RNA polymerase sigma-70 factor, ECF subfamily